MILGVDSITFTGQAGRPVSQERVDAAARAPGKSGDRIPSSLGSLSLFLYEKILSQQCLEGYLTKNLVPWPS